MELAVVVVQSFRLARHFGRISRSAPYLNASGRECAGMSLDLVEVVADVARLGEYDCAGVWEEIVRFEVVEVVRRLGAEIDGDGVFGVSRLATASSRYAT